MNKKHQFFQLSQWLTGYEALDRGVSDEYYNDLYEEYKDELTSLIEWYSDTMDIAHLNSSQNQLLNAILYLWYTSELIQKSELSVFNDSEVTRFNKRESNSKSPNGYYEGLVWKAAKAHPIGLTGGYFGYWRYRPEN